MSDERKCVPLCGAAGAYGRFAKPWQHELECPVRQAWEAERVLGVPVVVDASIPLGVAELRDEHGVVARIVNL